MLARFLLWLLAAALVLNVAGLNGAGAPRSAGDVWHRITVWLRAKFVGHAAKAAG